MTDARDAWVNEVRAWITESLGPQVAITFVKERVWGAVARVTTSGRVFFFKAEGVHSHHEPVIIADIAQRWPALVPDVVAADLERSWLLLHDHGTPMSDSVDPAGQVAIFEQVIPLYAEMQRASCPLIDRWIAAGAHDRRAGRIPTLLEAVLAGDPCGELPLESEQRRAIIGVLPDLVTTCDELGGAPFAEALDHCDMHGGNVLVGRGPPRLVDWGDSCITHPFSSLFVIYQHAVAKMSPADRRPAALRLRDVYLEGWSDVASTEDLRTSFSRAIWLGYVIRALSFVHMLDTSDDAARREVALFLVRWQEQHSLLGRGDDLLEAIASQTED